MAVTLTITVSTADANRVVHALCVDSGMAENATNAKQVMINYIKSMVRAIESREAQQNAINSVLSNIDVNPT